MKDIKYYAFYNNELNNVTVFSVKKFTDLYNKEILNPTTKDKNLIFTYALIKACQVAPNYTDAAKFVKNAEYDEIKLIDQDGAQDFTFKTTLKNKNGADIKTYIFCYLDIINKHDKAIILPFLRHAQNINVIDNEVEK